MLLKNIKVLVKKIAIPCINLFLPKGSKRRNVVKGTYLRMRDKQRMAARREMLNRIRAVNRGRWDKRSFYYESSTNLVRLKNKYKGQRCFIVGTGPSLTVQDVEKLSGEITFSLNTIYRLFEFTNWRPTFYVYNDIMHPCFQTRCREQLLECLQKYQFDHVCISSSKFDEELQSQYNGSLFFLPTQDRMYQISQPKWPKFCTDCSRRIQANGTTAYLILQLAVYMGFEEVYLIGCDGKYTIGKEHFQADKQDVFCDEKQAEWSSQAIRWGFRAMRYAADKRGIKIFNATRGGYVEDFSRVDFDTLELK